MRALIGVLLVLVATTSTALAQPLRVGQGGQYATPCAAVAAAKSDDVIEIAAGTYTDSCAIGVERLTLRGVAGQPKIDLSGTDHPAQYKGIYVVTAADVTIENLELTGAHISADNGLNAAGIRVEAAGLTVRGCNIHDNQNGILGGTSGAITIEHSEFFHNGVGDGCNQGGCTHNLYIANIDTLYFRFNWSHAVATDTPDKGHLLKSRAKTNYITYNRLTGEEGHDSYEINLPNGGDAVIAGNVIEKGKRAGNSTMLSWGEEGATNPGTRVLVFNNTFVNDFGSGRFIVASGAMLKANNNLFVGTGTPTNTGTLSGDNLSGIDPLFVDAARFDYHLREGSPAIGKGVTPMTADRFEQAAAMVEFEYRHPLGEAQRASVRDVGAFEYSAGGVTQVDAGSRPSPSTGGSGAAQDAGVRSKERDAGGCACSIEHRARSPQRAFWAALLLAILLRRRRLALAVMFAACSDSQPPARDAASAMTRDATSTMMRDADDGAVRDAGGGAMRDAATQGSSTNGGSKLCLELGWCELTDTKLESVCPDPKQYPGIQANEGCGGVINDWGGGMADHKRNQLVIWGGGHRGYFGNEVYALDLNTLTMRRLNEPSDIAGVDLNQCASREAYADGRPSSRHSYDGLSYLPDDDVMLSIAGAGIPCGYAVPGTWALDLARVTQEPLGKAAPWRELKPEPHPQKASFGLVSDYDANSQRVILNDGYSLFAYDLGTNTYTTLNDSNKTSAHIDYHMTGRVDPKRKLFVVVGGTRSAGGGMQVFDISAGSDHAQQNWSDQVSGCGALLSAASPGLAYDPEQDRLVGWAGGDTIYLFNPDTKVCTTVMHSGGPGAQNENGTFGRFRYFPALKVFAVINEYRRNAYALRLTK